MLDVKSRYYDPFDKSGNSFNDPEEGIIRFNSSDFDSVHNAILPGFSGTERSFDLILQNRDNPEIIITVLYLKISDRMNILDFFRNSADVKADKCIIVTRINLTEEDAKFCEDLGIEIKRTLIITRQNTGEIKRDAAIYPRLSPPNRHRRAMQKKREKTTIVKDILQLAKYYDSVGITKIIYKCNLNYLSARNLLDDMIDKKLIEAVELKSNRKKYKITDSGVILLNKLLSLKEIVGD